MVDFTSDTCRRFFEHWQSLRGDAVVPTSATFLDNAQPDLAPNTYMIDRVDETVVVRLMGTGLVEKWGFDATGHVMGSAQSSDLEKAWYVNACHIIDQPCGMFLNSHFKSNQGRVSMIENIIVPLAATNGPNKSVVSYTAITDDLGYKEHPETFFDTPKIHWIDIGHGTPSIPPLAQ